MTITRPPATAGSTPNAFYRALQVAGLIAPLFATALTIYGIATHRAGETNLFFATLFAQGWAGFVLAAFIRLVFIISVTSQTEYLWRRGQRHHGLLIMGWALPFLTALAPSERYAQERQRRHKPVTVWARQLIRQVHRWLPERRLVVVGDRGYAAIELLAAVRSVATLVTRLRLDAHLCAPPPPRAGANGSSPPGRQTASHLGAVAR